MTELPYFQILSNIPKYFQKIKDAETPDKFEYKFLKETLGFKSGNDTRLIPFLKAMGFIDSSAIPKKIYHDFRSEAFPSKSLAIGFKEAFQPIFSRNVNANEASEEEIKGHVVSITGQPTSSPIVRLITSSFFELKKICDFTNIEKKLSSTDEEKKLAQVGQASNDTTDIKLSYTIVLNLPATTTKEVYDTLFASLKENLLKN